MTESENDTILKNFMEEQFDFDDLKVLGFFEESIRYNYKEQAKRVCTFFGLKSVYEYGAKEIICHISYGDETGMGDARPLYVDENGKLKEEPFITEFKSIYRS